jgi:hypothetical protein
MSERKAIVRMFEGLGMYISDAGVRDGVCLKRNGDVTYRAGYFYQNRERDARITKKLTDAGLKKSCWPDNDGDFQIEDHFNAWPRDSWMQWNITARGVGMLMKHYGKAREGGEDESAG